MLQLPFSVDMKRRDVLLGSRVEANSCPIARSIKRATSMRPVLVYGSDVIIGKQKFVLPKEAKDFVRKFDSSMTDRPRLMQPISFMLNKQLPVDQHDLAVIARMSAKKKG